MKLARPAAAFLAGAALAACGVKSPPRPPLAEGARPPPAAASPTPLVPPVPGTAPQQAPAPPPATSPAPDGGSACCTDLPPNPP